MKRTLITLASLTIMMAVTASSMAGGGAETIKVSKAYSTGGVPSELLVKASSSIGSAHLYVYLPDGTYLGETLNGGGSRYGGSVFLAMTPPASLTIVSSAGARITVPTTPFQP